MKQHDNLSHKLIARILLAGLFLQSCHDFSNPVVPQVEKLADSNQELTHNQTLTNRMSIDPVVPLTVLVVLTAHGGHVVSFYEEQGKLRADVEEELAGNFQKKYSDLPVYVGDDFGDGFDVAQMEKLDPKHQRQLVTVQLPQGGQQGYVYIGKRGLLGGMRRTVTKKGSQSPNLSGRTVTSSKLQDKKEEAKFQEKSQQHKLKKHVLDQVFQPADHQKIKLAFYQQLESPPLSGEQRTNLAKIIKHAVTELNLVFMYEAGRGVGKGELKALELYLKSAEQGHAAAQCNLGLMYANGFGVDKDEVKAVSWYLKSVEQGNAAAQFNLAFMYEAGRGVGEDDVKAVELYLKSAEQGHVAAQCNLGLMYAAGRGVGKDDVKALELYLKSAEQGNAVAQFSLGFMYAAGRGVGKDEVKAVELYLKSAEQGNADARATA